MGAKKHLPPRWSWLPVIWRRFRAVVGGRACNKAVESAMLIAECVIGGQCPIIGLQQKHSGVPAARFRQIIIGGLHMYSFTSRLACICLLGVAISASRASAWWPSPQTAPDAPPQTEPAERQETIAPPKQDPKAADKPKSLDKSKSLDKPKSLDKSKPGEKRQPKVKPDRKSKADAARQAAAKKRKSRSKFQMNPNAKWACDQQIVLLEPVWRGAKTLTFPFSIRNEGTADLRIRAKGG